MLKIEDLIKYEKIKSEPVNNTKLFDHQKLLISACMNHELKQSKENIIMNLGFINDITGSGKTICVISMITLLNAKKSRKRIDYEILPNNVGCFKNYKISDDDYFDVKDNRKSLIIVPLGLAPQWNKELKKFSKLPFVYLDCTRNIKKFDIETSDAGIILCKSSMLKKFFDHDEKNKEYIYSRVFIDECDSINISFFPYIKSDFYWFVSATCEKGGQLACKNYGFIRDTYANIRNFRWDNEVVTFCEKCGEMEKLLESEFIQNLKKPTQNKNYHCEFCCHIIQRQFWGSKYTTVMRRHKDYYRRWDWTTRKYIPNPFCDFIDLLSGIDPTKLCADCKTNSKEIVLAAYCRPCNIEQNKIKHQQLKKMTMFRNDPEFVNYCTSLSVPNEVYIDCLTPKFIGIVNRTQDVIDADTIRMINSGDFRGAAENYGVEVNTGTNIIVLIKQDMEKKIKGCKTKITRENKKIKEYELNLALLDEKTEENEEEWDEYKREINNAKNRIKTQKDRVKRLKYRLDSLVQVITEVNNETCGICIDTLNTPSMVKCCNMLFCFACISNWMIQFKKKTCPNCRSRLTKDTLITISKDVGINKKVVEDKDALLSKEDNIRKLFVEKFSSESKILIFTEQDNTITKVESILKELGIKYLAYKKTSTGFTNIKGYTDGDIQVALLNSVSHGAGLNLQMTTDIILFHKMSSELETQAIGRAQRPGRKEVLNVYRLSYDKEYEDHQPHLFQVPTKFKKTSKKKKKVVKKMATII